ncbi:MAG: hypothetical protein U0264_10985 [Candidatus Kapaibacterium sp.]
MMKRTILLLTILLATHSVASAQEIPIPEYYTVLDTVSGDLDNDRIPELVVAYNTKKEDDGNESVPRELRIYKIERGAWTLWKKSLQALYGSRDGGMMGDPFGEMTISNGVLSISHDGGSSWKWSHTDKYRYQYGELYLIGYSEHFGKLCEYWTTVDFNLSTGKLIVKKEYERCENDTQEIYKRENEVVNFRGVMITLQKRREHDVTVVTPKYRHKIYIAHKIE